MEKHSFPLHEEATEQTPHMDSVSFQFLTLYAILAAVLSSVKQGKTSHFFRERCDLTFSPPSPVHGQKAAGTICSLLPESSRVVDEHRPKHLIKCGNGQTKRGLFSFTPFAP